MAERVSGVVADAADLAVAGEVAAAAGDRGDTGEGKACAEDSAAGRAVAAVGEGEIGLDARSTGDGGERENEGGAAAGSDGEGMLKGAGSHGGSSRRCGRCGGEPRGVGAAFEEGARLRDRAIRAAAAPGLRNEGREEEQQRDPRMEQARRVGCRTGERNGFLVDRCCHRGLLGEHGCRVVPGSCASPAGRGCSTGTRRAVRHRTETA
jgi:hypothetical protein